MDPREFKRLFSEVASAYGFTPEHGGWFQESPESIVVLGLQKSNFSNYFELNVKIFVQGLFGNRFARTKELVKKPPGDVFLRPPERYSASLDLEQGMTRNQRQVAFEALFREFLKPTSADALSRAGLASLDARGVLRLLPAVRRELQTSSDNKVDDN